MLDILISIIVPIYKVEPYLRQCLNSIINQTYTDLEIILVDDGSPDGCPQICDEYAARDKRIVVIHKENGGLSDARNAGLDICKGDYIYFLDSDDVLPLNCIYTLFKMISSENAEIASSSYEEFNYDDQPPKELIHNVAYSVITGSEALILLCKNNSPGIMSSCMKIYKKKCFDNIRFPKGKLYEDAHTNYIIYHNCKKICYTEAPLYYYRLRNESIMGQTRSTIFDLEAREKRYAFLKDHNEPAAQYCIEQLCWDYLLISVQPKSFFTTNFYTKTPREAIIKFKSFASDFLKTNHGSISHRNLIRIFFYFPLLYSFLYRISPWHLRKEFSRT